MYRAALSTIVALLIGVCTVAAIQTPSYAFVCPPGMSAVDCDFFKSGGFTANEAKNISNIMAQAAAQPLPYQEVGERFGSSGQARTAFGRALQKASGKIPPKAGKAGVIAGGATLGLTMWYLAADGSGQRGVAADGTWNIPANAAHSTHRAFGGGPAVGEAMITSVSWSTSGSDLVATIHWAGRITQTPRDGGYVNGNFGVQHGIDPTTSGRIYHLLGGSTTASQNTPNPFTYTFAGMAPSDQNCVQFYAQDSQGSGVSLVTPKRFFKSCSASRSGEATANDLDLSTVSNAREVPAEYVPPADGATYDPQETRAVYDLMRQDPEYQPHPDEGTYTQPGTWYSPKTETPPVTDHGPVEWTRQNPDGSTTTRYQDGTEVTTWPDGWQATRPQTGDTVWTRPDGSTMPNTETAPHNPPDHTGPGQGLYGCPIPPKADFEMPEATYDSPFPFSLIFAFFGLLDSLVESPRAPVLDLPDKYGTDLTFSMADSYMVVWRDIMKVVMTLAFLIGLYRIVSQSRSD